MKGFTATPLVVLAFSLCSLNALAQSPGDPLPESVSTEKTAEQKHDEWVRRQIHPAREKRAVTKGLLAPSEQDRADHENFLSQRGTGLIRLMPREVYDWESYKTPQKIKLRGGGAYYSFFYLSHDYGWGSDLSLEKDYLSVGFGGADYGMLTNLGNISLEDITSDQSAFISNYKAAHREKDARKEYRKFQLGETIDGALYQSRLPCDVGSTYLLRSIYYDTSDILIAFSVVRKDTDGSIIIAWKLLKNFGKPELARN
jgi:hypothetical protein